RNVTGVQTCALPISRSSVLFPSIGTRHQVRTIEQLRHRLWRNWRTSVLEIQPSTTAKEKLPLLQDVSDGLESFFSKVAFACECGHSRYSSEVFFHVAAGHHVFGEQFFEWRTRSDHWHVFVIEPVC